MGKIVRPGEAVPVQARRTVPPPMSAVEVPNGVPPAEAGGPRNVIYVTTPAAPPVEVHHHHHHTTQVIVPGPTRRLRRTKGTSFLGTLGFVVGGLACGAALVPQVAGYARWIALAGLAAAAVAWVGAVLLRRVGAGMPLAGIIVSVVGYGLGAYETGQGQAEYNRMRAHSPVALPAVRIPAPPLPPVVTVPPAASPSRPPSAAPRPATVSPPRPSTPPPPQVGQGTIFDFTPTTRP